MKLSKIATMVFGAALLLASGVIAGETNKTNVSLADKVTVEGKTLADLGALPERDYAAHGGSVPIIVKGTGCVGAVTVSGLPQRDDHRVVVEAMAEVLGRDLADIALH